MGARRTLAGVQALANGGSRTDHLAALIASSAELSTLSRNIHHLTSLLRQGNVRPALEYREMLRRVAEIEDRRLPIVPVPLLSPALSSRWLALVTDVDVRSGRNLVDSMVNEVVVTDTAIRQVVPFEPMSYDAAVRAALAERQRDRR